MMKNYSTFLTQPGYPLTLRNYYHITFPRLTSPRPLSVPDVTAEFTMSASAEIKDTPLTAPDCLAFPSYWHHLDVKTVSTGV